MTKQSTCAQNPKNKKQHRTRNFGNLEKQMTNVTSFKFISKKAFRLVHTTVGKCVLSWEHLLTKTNAQYQVIQSDLFIPWLKVSSPLKGSLNIPKRSPAELPGTICGRKNARYYNCS